MNPYLGKGTCVGGKTIVVKIHGSPTCFDVSSKT
jgi:hypothetical protein